MVSCGLRLLNINKIEPEIFSFSVNVAYTLRWLDNRVHITKFSNKSIVLDQDFIDIIWIPKFYTIDLQEYRLLGPERNRLKVKKTNNGNEFRFTTEANVVFKCPINYTLFPFHSATCKLRMTSVSHKNDSIIFQDRQWPSYQFLDPSIDIQGYDYTVSHLKEEDTVEMSWSKVGWYSVTGLQIDLFSKHTKYIFLYFLPTTMLTMTSWVSHLLPPTSYPARISLVVVVFLCQLSIFNSSIRDTPSSGKG